jgi:hypothetical protein
VQDLMLKIEMLEYFFNPEDAVHFVEMLDIIYQHVMMGDYWSLNACVFIENPD